MTTITRIISNYQKGSGDWIIVYTDGEVIYEGHSLPKTPETFVDIAVIVGQSDSIVYHHLDDEQILKWEEYL